MANIFREQTTLGLWVDEGGGVSKPYNICNNKIIQWMLASLEGVNSFSKVCVVRGNFYEKVSDRRPGGVV